jgi:tetratricopeptide (TPR) repeat protein
MYLRGSKFNMTRRRRNSNPMFILVLLGLIGAMVYVNMVVVPATPPLFLPTNTPTRAPISYIQEAEEKIAQGKIQAGIAAYKQAVQIDPRNASNYITLAQLQVLTGSYDDAIDSAQKSLLVNANNSMAYAIRGWAYGYKGDFLNAESAVKKAIELDGNNGVAYAYYAEVLALKYETGKDTLGVIEKASEASRTAQRLSPNALETHRARGHVLEITRNYEEAIREYEAAIAVNPNIASLHLSLGNNYRALDQYPKAMEEYNRAIALDPANPLPYTYLASTYLKTGDYPNAIQYAQQAIKVSPTDPYMYGNLGKIYYGYKKYRESLAPFRLALYGGSTPEGVQVKGLPMDNETVIAYYYLFGLAAARSNECGDALKVSQYIIQTIPDNEIPVENAKAMVEICQQWVNGTSTPTRAVTPGKSTPIPTKKP